MAVRALHCPPLLVGGMAGIDWLFKLDDHQIIDVDNRKENSNR